MSYIPDPSPVWDVVKKPDGSFQAYIQGVPVSDRAWREFREKEEKQLNEQK